MSGTQNSYLKNQRAKQKKQSRDAKLERKHDKKNKPAENIHDMSSIYRPVELGFLPEEQFVGPANSGKTSDTPARTNDNPRFVNKNVRESATPLKKPGETANPRPVIKKAFKKD